MNYHLKNEAAFTLARDDARIASNIMTAFENFNEEEMLAFVLQGRSLHQSRVESFMHLANQVIPWFPMIPSAEVRVLRAKLIIEEALETVEALGVSISVCELEDNSDSSTIPIAGMREMLELNGSLPIQTPDFSAKLKFSDTGNCNMLEVIDGCCDVKVVTTGTLSAFGIRDRWFQYLIDLNNLAKFGTPGGYVSDGKDGNPVGKYIPSKNFRKADFYMPRAFKAYTSLMQKLPIVQHA